MNECLAPARPSPRFRRFFGRYSERLIRKRFNAIRVERESLELLRGLKNDSGPILLAMNHASWWDPLVGLVLCERFLPHHTGSAPMELAQWETFRFMRKLGLFGVDPGHPDAFRAMVDHVKGLIDTTPRTVFVITPQGAFADVRTPVLVRPGLAALAAQIPHAKLLSVACEYAFWTDQRPEIFLRAAHIHRPQVLSTPAWHRAISRTMQHNQTCLAGLVVSRDPAAFELLISRRGSSVNPAYDLLAKLRGRSTEVRSREHTA